MKTLKSTIIVIALLYAGTMQSQFLEKLKDKVEKKVEQTVVNKTADKAAQKTSKTMDKIFDPKLGGNKTGKKVIPQNVPSQFSFDYQYRLTMTTSQGKIDIDYFLKPGATYLGSKMNMGMEMFMVMDGQLNLNYMIMESSGNKMATATQPDLSGIEEDEEYDMRSFTITHLPNRTWLGYNCPEKKME